MRPPFQIRPLPSELFERLFGMSNDALAESRVRVYEADSVPGYPCRVSLKDADLGDEVLLLNHRHLDVETPFRSDGPIFVRRNAKAAVVKPNDVPDMLRSRPLSIRAYDQSGMMLDADVISGQEVEGAIGRFFDDPAVDYQHIHFARRGCYACRVNRI